MTKKIVNEPPCTYTSTQKLYATSLSPPRNKSQKPKTVIECDAPYFVSEFSYF